MRRNALLLMSLLVAQAPSATVSAQTFMGLGPGTEATAISADGSTVVGRSGSDAFRWTRDTGTQILGPGAPHAVSIDGSVVVGTTPALDEVGNRAFRWRSRGGLEILDVRQFVLGESDIESAVATDVSADGSVVTGRDAVLRLATDELAEVIFRWTEGTTARNLGPTAAAGFGAPLVSSDGSTIADDKRVWTESTGWTLIHPRWWSTLAMSADASTLAGAALDTSGFQSFRAATWTASPGLTELRPDVPEGFCSGAAIAISADASVVLGMESPSLPNCIGNSCFIWDRPNGAEPFAHVLTRLGIDLSGWSSICPTSLSADGRTIVGTGTNPDGEVESWIAVLDCPDDEDCDAVHDVIDNCPGLRTWNIGDADGNGIGNACECGDQSGDGFVDVEDQLAINDAILDPTLATPLCDTNDDDLCDVEDLFGVEAKTRGEPAYCARYPTPTP